MSDNPVFRHKFRGWDEQDARRHVNPDGSLGAIVALTAMIAGGIHLDASIEIGPRARIGTCRGTAGRLRRMNID